MKNAEHLPPSEHLKYCILLKYPIKQKSPMKSGQRLTFGLYKDVVYSKQKNKFDFNDCNNDNAYFPSPPIAAKKISEVTSKVNSRPS